MSVILPTYNRARLLTEAIDSVLAQTFTDFELIVVDDGSTDETAELISKYRDSRLRYVWQANQEKSAARNTGIRASQAPYVAFLDSDDLWLPDKLERQLAHLAAHPAVGLVHGQYLHYPLAHSEQARIMPEYGASNLSQLLEDHSGPYGPGISASTVIVRRACFERCGLFDATLPVAEDTDMWLRIAKHFPIVYVPGVVSHVRLHAENSSADKEKVYQGRWRFRKKFLLAYQKELTHQQRKRSEQMLVRCQYLLGAVYLKTGRFRQALRMIGASIRQAPALGLQFARDEDPLTKRAWCLMKPYLALALSLVRSFIAGWTSSQPSA